MIKPCVGFVVALFGVSACGGALPEPGVGTVSTGTSKHLSDIVEVAPAPSAAPETPATRYLRHRNAAQTQCNSMDARLQAFALQKKTSAEKRTLWGAVVTAGLGGAGGIATAISSSQQSVSSGGTNVSGKDTTTVLGAVTAGVTLLGTALTLAVIGPPPANALAAIDKADAKVVGDWGGFVSGCPIVPTVDPAHPWTDKQYADWYAQCSGQADSAAITCTGDITAVGLLVSPYKPPSDAQPLVDLPAAPAAPAGPPPPPPTTPPAPPAHS